MRTAKERIRRLHKRSRELERNRERRRLAFYGCASVFLAAVLPAMMLRLNGLSGSISQELLGGSSLLSQSAGGYVLAAVLAFFAGVIITVAIHRYRSNHERRDCDDVSLAHKDDDTP